MKTKARTKQTRYETRGVSADKTEVHTAIAALDPGIVPTAFCKILPDRLGGDSRYCNILHADTAGTKAGLAYMAWKFTGNIKLVREAAVAAAVMNTDDVGCVGVTGPMLINQTIGRNKLLVPGEVIQEVIAGMDEFCTLLTEWGVPCYFAGGETADVGDIVRTLDVGSSIAVRMQRKNVIDAGNMGPGDYIVGISSTGRAAWEMEENTGMGANGMTNARHDVLTAYYRNFSELFAPEIDMNRVFCGKHMLDAPFPGQTGLTIAEALLSPTRTYMPLIKKLLDQFKRWHIHAIIHCSGGGQTKIGKFGRPELQFVKTNLFPPPPLFGFLQQASKLPWREMYQTYNMGHRLEIVVPSKQLAREIIQLCEQECWLEARIVGRVKKRKTPEKSRVVIETLDGTFEY